MPSRGALVLIYRRNVWMRYFGSWKDMNRKVSSYMGLAMAKGRVRLLILAEDISENSEKKMMKEVRRHGVKCVKYGTSDELSAAAGESGRTVFALCDRGFAEVILREIDREAE